MRAVDGLPCPQTTATGFFRSSIATAMQSCWRERPRLRASPGPLARSASAMYAPSIQTRPSSTIPSWYPSTVANTRCRHSQAVWCVMPHTSAAASTGTFHVMSSTNRTRVGKSFLQFSNTVFVRELKRAPRSGRLYLWWPARVRPSFAAFSKPHLGHFGRGR